MLIFNRATKFRFLQYKECFFGWVFFFGGGRERGGWTWAGKWPRKPLIILLIKLLRKTFLS